MSRHFHAALSEMHRSHFKWISLFLIVILGLALLYNKDAPPRPDATSEKQISPKFEVKPNTKCAEELLQEKGLYRSWLKCIRSHLEVAKHNHTKFWYEIEWLALPCNQPYANILSIKDYANSDEVKHHISPITGTTNNTVVTLGIGHDITAEEKLIHAMGHDNLQFYGADPVQEINKDLYTKIGKFFPVAVAGKAGYAQADVFEVQGYQRSTVVYVDAVYLLTKMIGLKFYDELWIDNEGGEYDMFPMFLKGGAFDQNDITVCQFNMEIHVPDDAKQKLIHEFLFQMVHDERYGFFYAKNVGHLRIFFLNFDNENCAKKYVPQQFDTSQLCS